MLKLVSCCCGVEDEQGLFDLVLREFQTFFKATEVRLYVQEMREEASRLMGSVSSKTAASGASRDPDYRTLSLAAGDRPCVVQDGLSRHLVLPLQHDSSPVLILHLTWDNGLASRYALDNEMLNALHRKLNTFLPWKHVLLRIAAAKKHLESIFDHLPGAVGVINAKFELERVNKTFTKMFNVPYSQAIGRKCYQVVHRLSSPHPNCQMLESLETSQRLTAEVGNGREMRATFMPLVDSKNEPKTLQIFEVQDVENCTHSNQQTYDFLHIYNLLSQHMTVLSLMMGILANNDQQSVKGEHLDLLRSQVNSMMSIMREAHAMVLATEHAVSAVNFS